jgi:hypothetical protein
VALYRKEEPKSIHRKMNEMIKYEPDVDRLQGDVSITGREIM